MSDLGYLGIAEFADMHGLFPRQVQPPIVVPDFIHNYAPAAIPGQEDIVTDPLMGCSYARPIFVPWNQYVQRMNGLVFGGLNTNINPAYPTIYIDASVSVTGTDPNANPAYNIVTPSNLAWNSQNAGIFPAGTLGKKQSLIIWRLDAKSKPMNGQGLILMLAPSSMDIGGEDTYYTPNGWSVHWKIADVWWRVYTDSWVFAEISFSTDGGYDGKGTWTVIRQGTPAMARNVGGTRTNTAQWITVDVMIMNGSMKVAMPGFSAPFVTKLSDETPATATIDDALVIYSNCGSNSAGFFPYCFSAKAKLRSTPVQIGFIPDPSTPPTYHLYTPNGAQVAQDGVPAVQTWPKDTKIQIDTVQDSLVTTAPQYDITVDNGVDFTLTNKPGNYQDPKTGSVDVSYVTAVVNRVALQIDGITEPPTGVGAVYGIGDGERNDIKEIVETISFNPGDLTIRHQLRVTMNNWYGIDYLASRYGFQGAGNFAFGVALGYPGFGVFQRFMGICHTVRYSRPGVNQALAILECEDQMMQLQDVLISAPPNFDGWNHYYAMAYLAEYAGITRAQFDPGFLAFVPDDPFTATDADPLPYFLPIGQGVGAWTPVNRTLSVLELMNQIRRVSGYMMFFDAYGFLHYQPWIPASPADPKRVFQEFDGELQGLTDMHSLEICVSNRETRNSVVVIGIDSERPDWPAIVTKLEDEPSIFAPPGQQPKNYVGYPARAVMMDSRFANVPFAQTAAGKIFSVLRQPQINATVSCWLQPDLFPPDCIWVQDSRSNADGVPFYIFQQQNIISVMGGNKVTRRTTLTGRYLDPSLLIAG